LPLEITFQNKNQTKRRKLSILSKMTHTKCNFTKSSRMTLEEEVELFYKEHAIILEEEKEANNV